MVPAGDTPKATRRRVRAFVVTALVVLGVVGFWPLRGYRIDDKRFVESLGIPNMRVDKHALFPDPFYNGPTTAFFGSHSYETSRESREDFDELWDYRRSCVKVESVPWFGIPSFLWRESGKLFVVGRWQNLAFGLSVVPSQDSGEKTVEEFARECLTAVLDGIDREFPGVTTFYNPPARQLWINRGKPAVEKIKRHFRKMFAP